MSKRISDVILALLGLAVSAPLFLAIAALVKLDSRGPVFFRQERAGRDGRPFRIYKFRTMVDQADRLGPRLTQKRDPRVTRIGAILRWLKLDELPQLVNVVKGEMSLVGPRPEDLHFVRTYTDEQRAVLSVRPGVVGPSQIRGRDELERYPDGPVDTERYYVEHILPEKLAVDLEYVRSASLVGDVRLLLGGLRVTVFGAIKGKFVRGNARRALLLAADTMTALVVYHLAYGLKFEWSYPRGAWAYLAVASFLVLVIRPPLFIYFGLYQNRVRYLGTREFRAIVKAVTLGSIGVVAFTFMLGFQGHSRLVFLIDWGLLVVALFGSRVAVQRWHQRRGRRGRLCRLLVVGASDTGQSLVSALAAHAGLPYEAVGFLDDDPLKRGTSIHGIRVLGTVADLPVVAPLERVDMVVVLFPHIAAASLRELVTWCRQQRLEYRLVPTLDRLLQGDVFLPEFDEPELRELMNGHEGHGDGDGAATVPEVPSIERGRPRTGGQGGGSTRHARGRADSLVLVTGGAGYIGSHVVRMLLARERRVRVVDTFLYGDHGLRDLASHPGLEVVPGDVRHLRVMADAAKGVEAVIALAALVGDAACDLDPEETLSTNLEATRLLADVCERAGVRRLVFASSCSVYGANGTLVLNEGSWLNPVSLYARTRVLSETELRRRTDRLSVTILRLATVFGLSSRMRLDLMVNTFAARAFVDRRIEVFGGRQWRPNLHVQDAARAFVLAAGAPDDQARGEVFNVGDDGLNYRVRDVAELVRARLPDTRLDVREGAGDQRDYRVSFDKIRHVLGFRTAFTVEDGIREVVQALAQGRIPTPRHERYHNYQYLKTHGFAGTRAGGAPVALGA